MLFNTLILAITSSIDSLGIGITYGIRNMKILYFSKIILFLISLIISFSSIFLGNLFDNTFPNKFTHLIGGIILIFIGFSMILKSIFENNKQNYYDFNNSNLIDPKEAIILGLSLSLDSFGIGISYSLTGSPCIYFPIFISIFQIIFLSLGIFLGKRLKNISNIPDFLCKILSGILIIFIGICKL